MYNGKLVKNHVIQSTSAAANAHGPEPVCRTLTALGVAELDDLVHDVAADIASRVNNEGLPVQVAWLLDNGMTAKEIINYKGYDEELMDT